MSENQVLARSQLDLVRLEVLETFSSKVKLGKACCWNLLLFSSFLFRDCAQTLFCSDPNTF